MSANDRQVGGDHYAAIYQHWDFVVSSRIGYLAGCATKYIGRSRKKNGLQDLEKSLHYIDKLIENPDDLMEKRHPQAVMFATRYIVANNLNIFEAEAIILLVTATWRQKDTELRIARAAVEVIIQEETKRRANAQ